MNAPIRDDGPIARVAKDGKPAQTKYRTVKNYAAATELEIDLLTGRYNQIRLHFAHAGHPLLGERKYARGKDAALKCKRVALHAARLKFVHPWSGASWDVEAPLPRDLVELRDRAAGG